MVEVIVRAEAENDLLDIYARGIGEFGVDTARQYMVGIDHALVRLGDYPEIGAIFPGIRPQVRCLAYRRHHILYDFDGETVWVVRIIHHARDVRRLM